MASKTEKNWTVNSYVNSEWTDLVSEPSTVASIIISANLETLISIRLEDSGDVKATLLPFVLVGESEAYSFDIRSLNITGTQRLQVLSTSAGVSFTASGVV